MRDGKLTKSDIIDLDGLLYWMEKGNVEGVTEGLVEKWKKALEKVCSRRKKPLVVVPEMLNKGLPPIREKGKSVNVVLALWSRKIYCSSNQYIPRWTVANAYYYRRNRGDFEGWIDLGDMSTRPLSKKEKRKVKK